MRMLNRICTYPYLVIGLVFFLANSCKKTEKTDDSPAQQGPVLTTKVTAIMPTTASSGGNVTSDIVESVIARGVCWNISTNPTIANSKTTDGTGKGTFTSSITGLTDNTIYYVRAYATTSISTLYGISISFKTALAGTNGTVTDIDGNIYNTITIGTQVWMAENLSTIRYRNGDPIGTTNPSTKDISLESAPKYQWSNPGYGRFYTGYAVFDSRNVCPAGWHVPTDVEWATLENYLGPDAGGKLKGTMGWSSPNIGATNVTGFTAMPGDLRPNYGTFDFEKGYEGHWWSSTQGTSNSDWAFYRSIANSSAAIYRNQNSRQIGLSVRCLKD